MATVAGIDVSHWQSGIDWSKVRANGQRYVILKASEGTGFVDSSFKTNWAGAKAAGLLRSAYCYFHPNLDARAQADHFIDVVRSVPGKADLPYALDLEVANGVEKTEIVSGAKVWLDRVEDRLGKKPFIYSGVSFLETYFSEIGGGPPSWTKDYPLWLAWYPFTYSPGMKPRLPRGWFKWTIWQYSKDGAVDGINAEVDMDLFNGTLKELYEFAGAEIPELIPTSHTVVAGDTFESISGKYGLTLRELADANPQLLVPGARVTIPVAVEITEESESVSETRSTVTYTVKPGDTLTAIAIKFRTTVPAIAAANNIPNPDLISVGQVLTIP
ncbi:MAG: LysM peptidoglycan-binding domain-containing protein [Anaerolineales bacterium]|nr:LysM peptidoglycan-binding domain-containing protein [Anaerolineales bacterium]